MTNLIQIIYWFAERQDIVLVWAAICKWCNDNFIEDHNACIANSLATKLRLSFPYVQFIVMLLAIKRIFNKSFRDMLGTGEVDITNEMASYGRKQRRTPSSTNTGESEAAKDSQKYVGD